MRASRTSQIWVTTHSESLAAAPASATGESPPCLAINKGATQVLGLNGLGERMTDD